MATHICWATTQLMKKCSMVDVPKQKPEILQLSYMCFILTLNNFSVLQHHPEAWIPHGQYGKHLNLNSVLCECILKPYYIVNKIIARHYSISNPLGWQDRKISWLSMSGTWLKQCLSSSDCQALCLNMYEICWCMRNQSCIFVILYRHLYLQLIGNMRTEICKSWNFWLDYQFCWSASKCTICMLQLVTVCPRKKSKCATERLQTHMKHPGANII